jgi:type IV secretory pathway VirB10-like protein
LYFYFFVFFNFFYLIPIVLNFCNFTHTTTFIEKETLEKQPGKRNLPATETYQNLTQLAKKQHPCSKEAEKPAPLAKKQTPACPEKLPKKLTATNPTAQQQQKRGTQTTQNKQKPLKEYESAKQQGAWTEPEKPEQRHRRSEQTNLPLKDNNPQPALHPEKRSTLKQPATLCEKVT